MPKAKIIKLCACAFVSLLWAVPGAAQSPPVIGKLIEQAKKNKLNELAPPPPVAEPLPGLMPTKALPPPLAPTPEFAPVLWSLSGVNQRLTAEILIAEEIHRVKVARGASLPAGWTVMAGDVNSLTLRQGQKVLTLFPADPGSTGAEYPGLRKATNLASSPFGVLQDAFGSRGISVEFPNSEPARPAPAFAQPGPAISQPATARNIEQARQAAGSLPNRP
jgi:hypothetical protein